jgi:hypothetical protein
VFSENFVAEAAAWHRYQQALAYLDFLRAEFQQAAPEPASSTVWLEYAEAAVERLNPGTLRGQRLVGGYEPPEWTAPFGEPIVSPYPAGGQWR